MTVGELLKLRLFVELLQEPPTWLPATVGLMVMAQPEAMLMTAPFCGTLMVPVVVLPIVTDQLPDVVTVAEEAGYPKMLAVQLPNVGRVDAGIVTEVPVLPGMAGIVPAATPLLVHVTVDEPVVNVVVPVGVRETDVPAGETVTAVAEPAKAVRDSASTASRPDILRCFMVLSLLGGHPPIA